MGGLKCHLTTHIPAQSRAGSAEDIWRNSTGFGVTVNFPGMNLTNMGHSTVETLGSVYEVMKSCCLTTPALTEGQLSTPPFFFLKKKNRNIIQVLHSGTPLLHILSLFERGIPFLCFPEF